MARSFLLLGLACAVASTAQAHAFLDTATPGVGGTVHQSPPAIRLHFTEALEPAFSTIAVLDADGHAVDTGKASVDPADASYLELKLPPLSPGRYKVEWRVVSVDTHKTNGDFTFQIAP